MPFMTTLEKLQEFQANLTDMITAKNLFYSIYSKTIRSTKYNKEIIVDDTAATDQTCILDHITNFYETLF